MVKINKIIMFFLKINYFLMYRFILYILKLIFSTFDRESFYSNDVINYFFRYEVIFSV